MAIFKNTTDRPQRLMGPNGTYVIFARGHYTSNPFFKRYAGKGLTEVPSSDPTPSEEVVGSVSETPPRIDPAAEEALWMDEDCDDYLKRKGIYFCKRCGTYRTSTREQMDAHLQEYHVRTAPTPVSDDEVLVRTSMQDMSPPVEDKEEVFLTTMPIESKESVDAAPTPQEPMQEVVVDETPVWTCPVDNRVFATEQGLRVHMARAHADYVPGQ